MADEPAGQNANANTDPNAGGDGNGATAGSNPGTAGNEPLGENGLKALQAERAAKTAEKQRADALEAELQKYRDAGKSAEQKAAEERDTLARERDTATVRALRFEVCADKDLPLAAARFLTGTTKAEIEEAADAFKTLGVATKPATGLPPSPNAGRNAQAPSGAAAGREEAARRFGTKTA